MQHSQNSVKEKNKILKKEIDIVEKDNHIFLS